mmetsp:Transcript_30126/g.54569  ORF Transcript_30126/g.54569 Transcript_30126/m.54569 type:complete len:811 (+) Transcript_30126:63-2495(+)|eukprot:CAMPEP_0197672758 /NCGR_PEP_ID=MMETSP1338-20131121/79580_1 /TAXON_ID=43686 ORGANISM="Pelagodinium beii, Strain RCC1491" /NCGR_SAMPLE_ID=MMETSP1338 /ASSEMBLY_ACC=CAM_ASM_000754 /LENGTH=810 /DNA_ID=CAMNT_0043252901 /DNA_START=30 /DNA_END=2462 /DNA_ORIENTATION=-
MVVPPFVPPLGLSQLRQSDDQPREFFEDSFSVPAPVPLSDARREETLMTPALRGWIESVVDARVEQALSAGGLSAGAWMKEGKMQRLEDELRTLAESQDQLVRVVDGLTGDAERQNVDTNKVRQEALSGVQRVISTVDDLQRTMGKEGEGVLSQLYRVSREVEELQTRHAEEAERFRTEMSDLRRLQTEASLQHRDCMEQLNAVTSSFADFRKDVHSPQRDERRPDEGQKVEHRIHVLEKQLANSAAKLQREQQELEDADGRIQEACGRLRGEHESHDRRLANVEQRVVVLERNQMEHSDMHEQVQDLQEHRRSFAEFRAKEVGETKQLLTTLSEQVKSERDARERQHASQERRLNHLEETFNSRSRAFGSREELTDAKQLLTNFGEEVQSERDSRERQFASLERRLRDFEESFNSRLREFVSREAMNRLASELQSFDAKFQELTDTKQLFANFGEQVQNERESRERQYASLERSLRELEDTFDARTRELGTREAISRLDQELQKVDAKFQEASLQLVRVRELDGVQEQLRQVVQWKSQEDRSSQERRKLQDQVVALQDAGARNQMLEAEAAKLDSRLRTLESVAAVADERGDRRAAELERHLASIEAEVGEAIREFSPARDIKELHSKISALQRDLQQQSTETEHKFRKVEDRFGTATADALEEFLQKLHRELDSEQYIRSFSDCKRSKQFREELRDEFRRFVEAWDGGLRSELPELERQLVSELLSETRSSSRLRHAESPAKLSKRGADTEFGIHRTRRHEVTDDETATQVTPDTTERMSKELDLFVGLSPADAARIFVHRANHGLRA